MQDYLIQFSGAGLWNTFRYRGSCIVYKNSHSFPLETISYNKGQENLPHETDNALIELITQAGFFTVKNISIFLTGG